jgi:hypothetical protein
VKPLFANALFDECIPSPLRKSFQHIEVTTAQEMGWGRLKNGDLLRKAEGVFDVFLSADQNLSYQQNLAGRKLAIAILPTNHWPTLEPYAEWIAEQVMAMGPGEYRELKLPS